MNSNDSRRFHRFYIPQSQQISAKVTTPQLGEWRAFILDVSKEGLRFSLAEKYANSFSVGAILGVEICSSCSHTIQLLARVCHVRARLKAVNGISVGVHINSFIGSGDTCWRQLNELILLGQKVTGRLSPL